MTECVEAVIMGGDNAEIDAVKVIEDVDTEDASLKISLRKVYVDGLVNSCEYQFYRPFSKHKKDQNE